MGVFDQDLLLPGVVTDIINEYSKDYDPSLFGTTDSVVVLGTAFNGPVGKPVPIYSVEHARYVFGDVYDYKSKKQATLVGSIQDAYERGCRTIYAVRISGKEISKDFQFKSNTELQLRVVGNFPSNDNKDIYMYYDDREGASTLTIYKPAKRATIAEKKQGLVEKEDAILSVKLDLSNSYGYTKETRLIEIINTVNNHTQNNVLKLMVVDQEGVDVTYSNEAQYLLAGDLFPGAYFIGRDKNVCRASTLLNYEFTSDISKPYESYSELVYKKLEKNTDITANLPIYGKSVKDLNDSFNSLVVMTKIFDFLAIPGKADLIFPKDSVDYEEVELDTFEIYRRLGSGFAVTAKCEPKPGNNDDIKIKETPDSDTNKIQPIQDGIYSMLENFNARYRVLAGVSADDRVAGPIPKKKDFQIVIGGSGTSFDGKIDVEYIVDKKDIFEPKKYSFTIRDIDAEDYSVDNIRPKTYTEKIAKRATKITSPIDLSGKTYKDGANFATVTVVDATTGEKFATLYAIVNGVASAVSNTAIDKDLIGSLLIVDKELYEGQDDSGVIKFVPLVDAAKINNKDYILVQNTNNIGVYGVVVGSDLSVVTPLGAIEEVFDDSEDKFFISVESDFSENNEIIISASSLDFTTLDEFVELLNENSNLKQLMTFAVNENSLLQKDDYIIIDEATSEYLIQLDTKFDVLASDNTSVPDRSKKYDLNLYIPFKTHDNFARQLAQHCQYTSLKNSPSEGFIGLSKLQNTNLTSVAKKVDTLLALDLNLYAKTPMGRDILDKDNMPYSIARKVSITAVQYPVYTNQNYTFISNGASGYAGMVSSLPLDHSSTNQPISIPSLSYEYSNYQLGKLTQKGFVTIKQSYTKGYVITDGITMDSLTSQFRRLSVSRISGFVEYLIRAAAEPFIGKQNSAVNKNSMSTSIKSSLDTIKGTLIEDYNFKLIPSAELSKQGIVLIDYGVVPIYEIREVRNSIEVKNN